MPGFACLGWNIQSRGEKHIGVNHLAPFALTGLLMPLLKTSNKCRVVTVSSLAEWMFGTKFDLENLDNHKGGFGTYKSYGISKLANSLFTKELNRLAIDSKLNVVAIAAYPGLPTTPMAYSAILSIPDIGPLLETLASIFVSQPPNMGALPTLYAATCKMQ